MWTRLCDHKSRTWLQVILTDTQKELLIDLVEGGWYFIYRGRLQKQVEKSERLLQRHKETDQ